MKRSIFAAALVLAAAVVTTGSAAHARHPQQAPAAERPSPDDLNAAWNEQFDGAPCEEELPPQQACRRHTRETPFGYSWQERRNFRDYYGEGDGGYRRYFGGFHSSYYRNFATFQSGLNNDRYLYGNGWAW